jgi:hypothetical protein
MSFTLVILLDYILHFTNVSVHHLRVKIGSISWVILILEGFFKFTVILEVSVEGIQSSCPILCLSIILKESFTAFTRFSLFTILVFHLQANESYVYSSL